MFPKQQQQNWPNTDKVVFVFLLILRLEIFLGQDAGLSLFLSYCIDTIICEKKKNVKPPNNAIHTLFKLVFFFIIIIVNDAPRVSVET